MSITRSWREADGTPFTRVAHNVTLGEPGQLRRSPVPIPEPQNERGAKVLDLRASFVEITAGSDLLSHTVSHAVPSAVSGLTSVFGMGTGVTLIL